MPLLVQANHKETSKLYIADPFVGEYIDDLWSPLTKGQ